MKQAPWFPISEPSEGAMPFLRCVPAARIGLIIAEIESVTKSKINLWN